MITHIFRTALMFLLFIGIEKSMAQNIQVLEQKTNEPLLAVHVFLQQLDAPKGIYLITNEQGIIVIPENLFQKTCLVTASYLGYNNFTDTLVLDQNIVIPLSEGSGTLDEIVVTAQYAPGNINNSVHKIKVIDSKKIKEMAAVNLRDVLSQEMNIRISHDNILGAGMSMQGISGENVKIMIDGVPVIGRQNGNIDLTQINLNDIERIEIVEGPLSVNFGTNALAGTINLISKKQSKEKINLSLDTYHENVGTHNVSGNAAFLIKQHRISISGGRNFFDGWSDGDNWLPDWSDKYADSNRFKSWKPRQQAFVRTQYNFNLKNFLLGYKGEYFHEKITNRGLPRAPYSETAFDDYYYTSRSDHSIYGNGNLGKKHYLQFVGAYNYYQRIKNTYFKDLTTLSQEITTNAGDQDTSLFHQWMFRSSIASKKENAIFNYEAGIDFNFETANGVRIENQKQNIGDFASFASAEITPIKNLILRPGLRLAYNTGYKAPPVPSLNVKYSIKDFDFRASYAYGFRSPSIKELYFFFVDINHNIVGNANLKAEFSNNYTANIQYKKWKKHTLYKTEMSLFFNDIKNLITLAIRNDGNYTYINVGRYKTFGTGIQQRFQWKWLQAQTSANLTARSNQIDDNNTLARYNFSPEFNSSITATWEKIGLSASVFYKYNGKLPIIVADESGSLFESITEDYHMADATISKSFWKQRITFSLGCKNIGNVKNIRTSAASGGAHSSGTGFSPIGMGRIAFVKLNISFSK